MKNCFENFTKRCKFYLQNIFPCAKRFSRYIQRFENRRSNLDTLHLENSRSHKSKKNLVHLFDLMLNYQGVSDSLKEVWGFVLNAKLAILVSQKHIQKI